MKRIYLPLIWCFFTSFALSLNAQPKFRVIFLGQTNWSYSFTTAISVGNMVGRGMNDSGKGPSRAVLWRGTTSNTVNLHPDGFASSEAWGASWQQQVGSAVLDLKTNQYNHAFLWSGSADNAIDLHPGAPYADSWANAIDGDSQVGSANNHGNAYHAILWHGSSSNYTILAPKPLDHYHSEATCVAGIFQAGSVASSSGDGQQAIRWHGSAESALLLPFSMAYGVDRNGNVVGIALTTAPGPDQTLTSHAMLWQSASKTSYDLNPVGCDQSGANAISSGLIAGYGTFKTNNSNRALLWKADTHEMIDLHQYLPNNADSSMALTIDEFGNILGYAVIGGLRVAVLWVLDNYQASTVTPQISIALNYKTGTEVMLQLLSPIRQGIFIEASEDLNHWRSIYQTNTTTLLSYRSLLLDGVLSGQYFRSSAP